MDTSCSVLCYPCCAALQILHVLHRYTRNLIDAGNGKFNLMALCWGEGHGSSIHDHADAHCFVKVLDGELRETMFAWPSESEKETEMHKTDVNDYPKDGVTYINGKCTTRTTFPRFSPFLLLHPSLHYPSAAMFVLNIIIISYLLWVTGCPWGQ